MYFQPFIIVSVFSCDFTRKIIWMCSGCVPFNLYTLKGTDKTRYNYYCIGVFVWFYNKNYLNVKMNFYRHSRIEISSVKRKKAIQENRNVHILLYIWLWIFSVSTFHYKCPNLSKKDLEYYSDLNYFVINVFWQDRIYQKRKTIISKIYVSKFMPLNHEIGDKLFY